MDVLGEESLGMTRKRGFPMAATVENPTALKQWLSLMRKFTDASQEKSKCGTLLTLPKLFATLQQVHQTFPTDSTYDGTWGVLGMSGNGIYNFGNSGVKYEGEFKDGNFHGEGVLSYPDGTKVNALWNKGKAIKSHVISPDGLKHITPAYCHEPDRRFNLEFKNGLQPAGETYATNTQPTPEIPPGHFDAGDGFFDPGHLAVFDYSDMNTILRTTDQLERQWIEQYCRRNPMEPVGALNLYEEWLEPTLSADLPTPPPYCEVSGVNFTDSAKESKSEDTFKWTIDKTKRTSRLYYDPSSMKVMNARKSAAGEDKASSAASIATEDACIVEILNPYSYVPGKHLPLVKSESKVPFE